LRRLSCHIYFPDGHIGVSPTIIGLSRALASSGFEVTIYGRKTEYAGAGALPDGVQVVDVVAAGRWIQALGNLTVPIVWRLRRLAPFVESALFTVRTLRQRWAGGVRFGRSVGIGVNCDGAIASLVSARCFREPFVFLSLEMGRQPDDYRWAVGWRRLARKALRAARVLVIQGSDRLDVLARQYGWRHPCVLLLPNSAGPSTPSASPATNRFRRMFSIDETVPIALQAGMIDDASCSLALAEVFAHVDGWALVLHERRERTEADPYIQKLRSANRRNLHLSLKPVPFDRLGEVFEAATVGLAFYDPAASRDEAFSAISSSGKFALFLRYAKPVLVSDLPALSRPVHEHRCGIVVNNPADAVEIQEALREVQSDYAQYSRNARRCYEERFDFDERVKPLVRLLIGEADAFGGAPHGSE
jgi:hypothetical protein